MLSVVLPALNEEEGIGATLDDLQAALADAGVAAEIIVVDDGSTDGTAAIATRPGVTVLRHPVRLGYGRSLKDGILMARYDTVAIADADGTYPVRDIPRLLKVAGELDMLVGARTGPAFRGSFAKFPARKVFQWLVEFSVGQRIPDVNSGLRIMRKATVLRFLPTLSNGFSFTTTLTMAMLLNACAVTFVPVAYGSRKGRSKIRLFRDTLRTAQVMIESVLYYNPIKLFLLLSLPLWLASVGLGLGALVSTHTLWVLTLATLFFLSGWLVFALGLVADLLRRIRER